MFGPALNICQRGWNDVSGSDPDSRQQLT